MGKISEAIDSLNNLLEFSPTDGEAWSELADIYLSQGLYPQSIFALEEVLVLTPNAWNVSTLWATCELTLMESRCTQG